MGLGGVIVDTIKDAAGSVASDSASKLATLAADTGSGAVDALEAAEKGAQNLLGADFARGISDLKGAVSGSIDVHGASSDSVDYMWTLNTSIQARKLAPKIEVDLYQQVSGQITEAINRIVDGVGDLAGNRGKFGVDAAYDSLYKSEYIGKMVFPLFTSDYISLNHQFNQGGLADLATNALLGPSNSIRTKAAAVIKGTVAPKVSIELPKAYANTTFIGTTFSFNLFNTVGKEGEERESYIKRHTSLIDTLIFLNSFQRFGPALALPPVLCSYKIPGVAHSPVAQMSLDVANVGQVTYDGAKNVPDAFNVTITLTDLLQRSRNMHNASGPRTVDVFDVGAK